MAEERRRTADRVAEQAEDLAREAIHRIETHERVCTERYLRIVENLEGEQKLQKDRHEESQKAIGLINDRMWVAAGALVTSMLGLVMALIFTAPNHP